MLRHVPRERPSVLLGWRGRALRGLLHGSPPVHRHRDDGRCRLGDYGTCTAKANGYESQCICDTGFSGDGCTATACVKLRLTPPRVSILSSAGPATVCPHGQSATRPRAVRGGGWHDHVDVATCEYSSQTTSGCWAGEYTYDRCCNPRNGDGDVSCWWQMSIT